MSHKQKSKLFNIFEKVKQRNGATITKRINNSEVKMPRKRTTRLKSEIFVESCKKKVLSDDQYDINKEDFEISKSKFTPLVKKLRSTKPSKCMLTIDKYLISEQEKKISEQTQKPALLTNEVTEMLKDSNTENGKSSDLPNYSEPLTKDGKAKQTQNSQTPQGSVADNISNINSGSNNKEISPTKLKHPYKDEGIFQDLNIESQTSHKGTKKKVQNVTETKNSDVNKSLNNKTSEANITNNGFEVEKLSLVSEQTKRQGRKSKAINKTQNIGNLNVQIEKTQKDSQQGFQEKRKRGRPRKSTTPPRIIKINISKEFKKKKSLKLTKDKIKASNTRKIPKNRLDEVLKMIEDDDHPIWEDRNISCNASIHRHWEHRSVMISDQNMKLKYARLFILRRDWNSLSKILCLSSSEAKDNNYYPLLAKYATLCLAHTDEEQFNKFIKFLINMDSSSDVIKRCTNLTQKDEE